MTHRVQVAVEQFLSSQKWHPDLNKNQLRESLRRHLNEYVVIYFDARISFLCVLLTYAAHLELPRPSETCSRWDQDPPWEGAILDVVQPIEKHWEALLQCIQQRDHSVVKNGMRQQGSFDNCFCLRTYLILNHGMAAQLQCSSLVSVTLHCPP